MEYIPRQTGSEREIYILLAKFSIKSNINVIVSISIYETYVKLVCKHEEIMIFFYLNCSKKNSKSDWLLCL